MTSGLPEGVSVGKENDGDSRKSGGDLGTYTGVGPTSDCEKVQGLYLPLGSYGRPSRGTLGDYFSPDEIDESQSFLI